MRQQKSESREFSANPAPEGFIITEKARQEIRGRVIPDGVAMECLATFLREARDFTVRRQERLVAF